MKLIGITLAIGLLCSAFVCSALADAASDKERLAAMTAQENALIFDSFDNATARQLGLATVNTRRRQRRRRPFSTFDGTVRSRSALRSPARRRTRILGQRPKFATMSRFLASTESKKLEYRAMMGADWLKSYPNGGGDPLKFWNLTNNVAAGLVGGGFPTTVRGVGLSARSSPRAARIRPITISSSRF